MEYLVSQACDLTRASFSTECRDAFWRYNAASTETPSRFGGRRYGRATNPSRRLEKRFQYGSGVRLKRAEKLNTMSNESDK